MKVQRIGEVSYADLDEETQTDVALSIGFKTGEIQGDYDEDGLEAVRIGLDNGPSLLPLVLVDPKALLKASPGRSISKVAVRKYVLEMSSGVEFPPVVIDSSLKKDILIEGGHRTSAAVRSGLETIKAIDIADIRVAKQEDGLETYVFPG
jgi:stage III sporulation protein SpoIIIAA